VLTRSSPLLDLPRLIAPERLFFRPLAIAVAATFLAAPVAARLIGVALRLRFFRAPFYQMPASARKLWRAGAGPAPVAAHNPAPGHADG